MTVRRALLVVLCLLVAAPALPLVAAEPFDGPGQTGVIPLGDDGRSAALPGEPAAGRAYLVLDGIPGDVCRLVLDQNGTYGEARLTWTAGDARATLWAALGGREVPYRLHAVWHTDLDGACTAEETVDGIVWHDPTARPYTDHRLVEELPFATGRAGGPPILVTFQVHNAGTIGGNVSVDLGGASPDLKVVPKGDVYGVEVGPNQTVPFTFQANVGRDVRPFRYPIQVTLSDDTGWSKAATAIVEVLPANTTAGADGSSDPGAADPLAAPTVAPAEAPVSFFAVALAIAATFGVVCRGRRTI